MANTRKYATAKDPRKLRSGLRATLRKRVIAAYDTCAICGREVDKSLHYLDPLAPEVDEIVPVSRGGSPYDWDNLQLVHRICNQRKGNRMAGDTDLGKVENPTPNSRSW
jgi:5-methylcytosine-specific restriction endonuclease McrA